MFLMLSSQVCPHVCLFRARGHAQVRLLRDVSRESLPGIVVRTTPHDPLHPVVQLVDDNVRTALGEVDTSARDADGAYDRHIVETVVPAGGAPDVRRFLPAA